MRQPLAVRSLIAMRSMFVGRGAPDHFGGSDYQPYGSQYWPDYYIDEQDYQANQMTMPGSRLRRLPEHRAARVVLLLGQLGAFLGVTSLFAIPLGAFALRDLSRSPAPYRGKAKIISGMVLAAIYLIFWMVFCVKFVI